MRKENNRKYRDPYSKHAGLYERLYNKLQKTYGPVQLPAEYNYFIQGNLVQLLVRLSRFKFAAKMLRPADSVLEIGCGSGLGTNFLSQFCRHISAIDVKKSELDDARSVTRRKNIDFEWIDLFDLPLTRKYDAVVALDVIEHMSFRKGEKFVKKITNHLKEDGMLIIGTPSIYSFKFQSALSKASHIKLYDQEELKKMIDRHFNRTVAFSMNDEVVHTGFSKLAWYYFILAFGPKGNKT